MDNITYDVRIWKTEIYKGAKVTTYKVRWKTGRPGGGNSRSGQRPKRRVSKPSYVPQPAKVKRSTSPPGRPVSWGRAGNDMSWYDFCVSYVDMKWKDSSAHHRENIAWALITVMPAMLASDKGKPDGMAMRTALRQWGFNTKQRGDCPDDAATILNWVSRNTKPVAALADPATARAVLDAAGTLLDGSAAAPSTIRRNRAILHNALEYAVELRLLTRNPVKAIKWKAPKTTHEVDRRCVVNHAQARRLLSAVRQQMPSGPRLVAFFAIIYYAALRPEEAVNLRKDNITLPPLVRNDATGKWEEPADNWGELRFCSAATEIGAEWTDHGTRREHRHLKSRPAGEWRRVPMAPPLTRILRSHLDEFGTGRDGRVFSGIHARRTRLDHLPPRMGQSAAYRADPRRIRITARPARLRPAPCLRLHLAQRRGPARPSRRVGRAQRRRPAQGLRQVHRRPGPDSQAAHRRRATRIPGRCSRPR